jgi:hypothetical protein
MELNRVQFLLFLELGKLYALKDVVEAPSLVL